MGTVVACRAQPTATQVCQVGGIAIESRWTWIARASVEVTVEVSLLTLVMAELADPNDVSSVVNGLSIVDGLIAIVDERTIVDGYGHNVVDCVTLCMKWLIR